MSIPAISWSIAYLVIIGSILSFIAYIYMLQNLPAEINSIYAYINPIVAVLLGALIFGEALTMVIAIGGGITIFGLYMVNHSIRKARRLA
jgi:drug/metabolite transporter (DMT)-like permease